MTDKQKRKRRIQRKWLAAIPFICTIIYFLLAYCLSHFVGTISAIEAYGISLLVFLIIPFEYIIVGIKKLSFEYPLFITILYIVVCTILSLNSINLWHPLWVVFLTIPIFYIFYEKDSKRRDRKCNYDFDADED